MQASLAVDEAEVRGDAGGGIAIIADTFRDPGASEFWRPWRVRRLRQLSLLGHLLPRWATSRWILEQALQDLPRRRQASGQRALDVAIELRGGPDALPGRDVYDARARVIDRDWVHRQLAAYEYGGLAAFLRGRATPDLLAGADHVQSWATAPMGAYRLVEQRPATTHWVDLASGDDVVVPTLGSAVLLVPGVCAIGRLVPVDGGRMFETAPLAVPEAVAKSVAEDPVNWLQPLRAERKAGRPVRTSVLGFGYLTDLQPGVFRYALRLPVWRKDPEDSVALVGDLMKEARRALSDHERGRLRPDQVSPWPCLVDALTEPRFLTAVAEAPDAVDRGAVAELEGLLAEPASAVCRELIGQRREAA